ncbi:MAG: oligopeptide ABC transporter ATP-binding protein [SAR202 cluster bacterium Io17-Chloro-G3]|nr:MAG: oligopeptide ABC transporter ATP-binding protein [SAR202 cluster bacterium Io17-Chloro-G3]
MTELLALQHVGMMFHVRTHFFRSVGVVALRDVSISLIRGETLSLVGESGSGKTTLARICLRLLEPTTGRVIFNGMDLTGAKESDLKQFRRNAQGIFQDPFSSLDPFMNVAQIVEEPLLIHHLKNAKARRELVHWALEEVKLQPAKEFASKYPHMLSGGQRQRVAIARAVVLQPEMVVADEPVSMIDASSKAEILTLLRELQDRHSTSFIYITHDIATARHFSHRIAVMYLGRIVETGPTREVIENPLHPYTRALLEAVPLPDPANRFKQRAVVVGEPPSPVHPPPGCQFHPRCSYAIAGKCELLQPRLTEVTQGHLVECHLWPDTN